ncbi:MAG: hypothetical protein EPO07_12720, partial [Verrucomicrobia bacterium]
MNHFKRLSSLSAVAVLAALSFASSASAQLVAYDDAGNYRVSANWTNGSNLGFGFTPWFIATNGPNSHGNYVGSANNPVFVIATITNFNSVNYTSIFGIYANGTGGVNETAAFRGFENPLGTNTFKLQWGSRGAGVTTVTGVGQVHGWCGFTLRNGNTTNSPADFQTGARFYIYFLDGASPSTVYVGDGSAGSPISLTGVTFSALGRGNITNALEVEVTVKPDGDSYHMVLKDVVLNKTLYTLDSVLGGTSGSSIDSAALFAHETTGDQIYNHMQIAVPTLVPPTIVNVQPTNGSVYLDASTNIHVTFEVDSFNSTVSSNFVSVFLNGVLQTSRTFNTTAATNQLFADYAPAIAPNTFYTCLITAQDANGNIVTNTSTFNTFLATDLYIDAGDYNYGSGLFVDNPSPTNAYAGLPGTNGIDYLDLDLNGTNNLYRPGDLPQILSLNSDATGDIFDHAGERAGGYTTYNLGFTDAGEWQNYTRTIPTATNYSIYARAASGGGGQFEMDLLANS